MKTKIFNQYIVILFCIFIFNVKAQSQCLVSSISPSGAIYFEAEGGTCIVTATTAKSCTNYTVSTPSWITYTKNGLKVTLTVLPNTGVPRSGTVYIGSLTKSIGQDGNCPTVPAQQITGAPAVCQGRSSSYSVPGSSIAVSYNWNYSGTGATISGTGTSVTISFSSIATSGNLTITGVNSCGISGTTSPIFPITVGSIPGKPSITANGPTTVCTYDEAILTSSSGQSYIWSNGSISQSIQALNSGNYSVQVTNSDGCLSPSSDPVTVTINPRPDRPSIQVQGSTTFCQGGNVTLTALPTESSYIWSNGITSKSNTVNSSGIFTVQTKNSYGCVSIPSSSVSVIVNPLPSVSITSLNPPCDDNPFTLAGPSGMSSYTWTGPNSANGSSQNLTIYASHFDESTGTYYLTAKDGNGCSNSTSKYIEVNPIPQFTVSNNGPVCEGNSLNLTGPAGMVSYSWSGPKSFSSTDQNPTRTNALDKMTGTYNLMATDGNGCFNIAQTNARIDTIPMISASNNGPICEGGNIYLTGSSDISNYYWSGPNGYSSTNQNPVIINASSVRTGSYTLTSTNGACSSTVTTLVAVYSSTPVVLQGNRIICEGAPLSLAGPDGMVSYTWTGPGITGTNTSQNPVVSASATAGMSGTYTLTVTNSHSCTSAASEDVIVKPIDKTLPVGAVAGGFNVSSSGAATYQIPIFTSPGTNGMKPGLAVAYNSQAGNGYLGMGWNMTGFSTISRLPLTMKNDGQVRAVQLNAADRFGLDGNRLVVTAGAYGGDDSEYHTEAETFVKITSVGTSGSGPRWFMVETKDGRTIEYGNSATSYLQPPDKDEIMFWYISKITDKLGNYMTYTYHVDRAKGEFWPEKIDYTFNDNKTLTSYNSVNFTYQARPDNTTIYLAGYPIQHNVLLNQVQMISEGTAVREYDFIYTQNACPQLNEVVEYGKAHTKINSTFVNWASNTEKYAGFDTQFKSIDKFLIDDFNGDGKKEIISSGSGDMFQLNNNKTSFVSLGTSGLPSITDTYTSNLIARSGDFNGDGKSDMVLTNTIRTYSFSFYKSNGNSFSLVGNYGPAGPLHSQYSQLYTADFNGDGLTDVLVENPDDHALTIFWGDPVSPFSSSTSISNIPWWNKLYIEDINGDGKPELMTISISGYKIYEWQSTAFQLVQSGSQPVPAKDVYFGDFNGDGKRDFVYIDHTTYVFAISTGTGFISYTRTIPDKPYAIHIIDVNGDGHDEIVVNAKAYAWQANDLVVAGGWEFTWDGYLQDIDGDGSFDFLETDLENLVNTMKINYFGTIPKKVASITNGFENTIFITYKPLTDNTVHTLSADGAYRSIDFAPSTLVVSSVQSDNGKGGLNQIDYHYTGGKYDNRDGQFLGFASVSQTNNTNGIVSTSYSDIDKTYYISKPTKSEVKTTTGTLLTEASYTTTIRDFGNHRLFIYSSGQTSIDHLHGDATTSSSVVYNDDGNPTSTTSNAGGISTSTTTNTFTTAGGWCPNKLLISSTKNTRTGETDYTTSSSYQYYPSGLLKQQIAEPGNAKQVYTNYTYDDFGNVTQVKVSPDGSTGRVTNFQYETGKARMVTKRSNVLGHYVSYTNDYGLGVVTQAIDNNQLTTTYQYDNFGRLLTTTNTDGTSSTVTTNWITGTGAPQYAVYYSTAHTSGRPALTTYFDGLGRQLQSETTGFDGRKLISQTGYTTKGQVDYVTLPYYEGDDNTDRKSYQYDELGRVRTETAPGLDLTYAYNGLSTTVTNNLNNQSTTKVADVSGALSRSSDAGGTISYTYNAMGQVKQVTSPSGTNTMGYDQFGRQTYLKDPNSGGMRYDYNVYGELLSQTDTLNNSTSLLYDDIGRVYKRTENSMTTDWNYNTNGRLDSESANTGITYAYTYNPKGRPSNIKETETKVFKTDFNTGYEYNDDGQISTVTYPSGFKVDYHYKNGYLEEIVRDDTKASIWKLNSVNARGQVTQTTAGNGLVTIKQYDTRGYLQSINTSNRSIQDLEYSFNTKGLLAWRKDNRHAAITESFGYDAMLNRLTSATINGVIKSFTYADNGNILSKSDVGAFAYSASHPNAMETLTDNKGTVSSQKQDITYTSFSMPATLAENGNTASFTYGPEHERKIMTSSANGGITKYYSGSYERQLVGGITREFHYITANGQIVAIFEKKSVGTPNMYYVHTDHLGSLNVLTDANGAIAQETSYDAWGNRRDPATLQNFATAPTGLITDRGFTGHEHMDAFALINMNGRIYDPALGRFLSPDNYVQAPDFTQSYNRYSYCMNNPLSYTDPSGWLYQSAYQKWLNNFLSEIEEPDNSNVGLFRYYDHSAGSLGYNYSNGEYIDVATGKPSDYNTSINWAINAARSPGDISNRYLASNYGGFTGIYFGTNGKMYLDYNFASTPDAILGGFKEGYENNVIGTGIGVGRLVIDPSKIAQSQGATESDTRNTPFDGNAPISSPFKAHRTINGKPDIHIGTDYRVPVGTQIHATAAGTVVRSALSSSYGNIVILSHGQNVYTLYGHGSEREVSVGDRVNLGDVIMLSGNTGLSTGPHLHYEVIQASYPFSYSDIGIRYSPLQLSTLIH